MHNHLPPYLRVLDLSKRFCRNPRKALRYTLEDILADFNPFQRQSVQLRADEFWALRNLNFELGRGEALGLVGLNGAGKSTLANLLAGIYKPTLGQVRWNTDRVVTLDRNSGLSPTQTGKENILTRLAMHGFSQAERQRGLNEIVSFSGLKNFIDSPLGTYSAGMRLRLAFSIYTLLRPDVFIIDEALGAGDLKFQEKFNLFLQDHLQRNGSLILVSHHPYVLQKFCQRCLLLDEGTLQQEGSPDEVLQTYYKLKQESELALYGSASPETAGNAPNLQPTKEEVEIRELKLSNPEGGGIQTGSPVDIEIVCFAKQAVKDVVPTLMFNRGELENLAFIHPEKSEAEFHLEAGENTFRGRILQMPLMPGQYQVAVALGKRENAQLLAQRSNREAPFYLNVASPGEERIKVFQAFNAKIHLTADWR